MSKEYTEIEPAIQRWIGRQQMFFVSTAPNASDGHINCSPKGLDSLRVLGPQELAYADTGGSGIETVAHLKENGRITLMMCAFDGPPKIYRFYGTGYAIEPHNERFESLASYFPDMPAIRNIILIEVRSIIDSCGYGVPMYEFQRHRDSLHNYFDGKTVEEVHEYRRSNNAVSLDGLPGLDVERVAEGGK